MPEFTLHKIAEITHGKLHGEGNVLITNLVTDSRTPFQPDSSMFIAIRGERHNGHNFINDLIRQGVTNFLISENPDLPGKLLP